MAYDAAAELFYSRVDKKSEEECWPWKGALNSSGYGTFRLNGLKMGAHAASWLIYRGDKDKKLIVLHKCDNRACVNPAHLYLGTYSDNNSDRASRKPNEQGGHTSPITIEERIRIKELRSSGLSLREITAKVGYVPSTIYKITKGGL
jgi:hypothetical protein